MIFKASKVSFDSSRSVFDRVHLTYCLRECPHRFRSKEVDSRVILHSTTLGKTQTVQRRSSLKSLTINGLTSLLVLSSQEVFFPPNQCTGRPMLSIVLSHTRTSSLGAMVVSNRMILHSNIVRAISRRGVGSQITRTIRHQMCQLDPRIHH